MRYLIVLLMSLVHWQAYTMMLTHEEQAAEASKVSFIFEEHGNCGYRLNMYTPLGNLIADFCPADSVSPERPFYAYVQSVAGKAVVDLWPVNGNCLMPIKQLFSRNILKELSEQAKVADTIHDEQLRIFVLDLKDIKVGYKDRNSIRCAENSIRDLLLATSPKRAIHNRLKENKVRFFLREGLLKATLISEVLTLELSKLFDSRGPKNKLGRDAFCMLCEILMNGFKGGYEVRIQSDTKAYTLHPEEFFEYAVPASNAIDMSLIDLKCLHGLKLHTLYSAGYDETYGTTNAYYKALAKFFKTEHRREGNITYISVEKGAMQPVEGDSEEQFK